MEQARGRNNAKRNIIIFIIGTFLSFLAIVLPSIGIAAGIDWMSFFILLGLVGVILEVIAIIGLRNVNKQYANAMWALILMAILTVTSTVLSIVEAFNEGNKALSTASDWISVGLELAEVLIVVNFVLGTNELAKENDKGMPVLTKIIVYGYMGLFLISLAFKLLGFIPAISENTIVTNTFGIVTLVLYIIREIAYVFFLIKSLWRVQ